MKKLVVLACGIGTLSFAAASSAYFSPGSLPPTWHIHDCTVKPCTLPHAAVGFFPKMLTGGDVAAYLEDPAECPDGTDKALLGGGQPPQDGGLGPNQPLGTGICQTSTLVIHLKRITPDRQAPAGFTWLQDDVVGGVVYSTYYELTPN